MRKVSVSIIIVHWNTPDHLRKLLRSLSDWSNYQIVVVDNASDLSIDWVRIDFPHVELILNTFNRGFAFACNQGIVNARGEWILFLNPDIEIERRHIEELIKHSLNNDLAACSIKSENQAYQKPLPTWFSLACEFTPLHKIISLSWFKKKTLVGGCLLLKTDVLKSLGGWDERFFLWFDDSDLTKKLINKNYKIDWVSLPIKHLGGASFEKLNEKTKHHIFFYSMDIYAKKHFSFFGQLIVDFIKKRYSTRKLLPSLHNGISITIPNKKLGLLDSFFFFYSLKFFGSEVEWIVVTSSIDFKTIWHWRKKYPIVRFILMQNNEGFAKTVNIGFRASTRKWVGTVNDDVILENRVIEELTGCANSKTGSINAVILSQSGKIESKGIQVLKKGKALPIKNDHIGIDRSKIVDENCIEVDATNAAAVVYSSDALNNVGLFDERFESYLEDIDLSLRLKRGGYTNIVCLRSKVIHEGQSTSRDLKGKKELLDFKNWILVILKNWSVTEFILNFPSILIERMRNISGILKNV